MIKESDILRKTHYGLNIYSWVLKQYYPDDEVVIHLSGRQCKPAKNPFNENKPTLNIYNKDWLFVFDDTELKEFSGSPFDFAAKYYNLEGQDLLERINKDLYLHIGEAHFLNRRYSSFRQKVDIPKCSFFRRPVTNTIPDKIADLVYIHNMIRYKHYTEITTKFRLISDQKEARSFKAANFDYVTFSGTFNKRSDKELIRHSGLLTVDFDHVPDLPKLKQSLLTDDYFETELMFTSPSGDGLKWIIPIDLTVDDHLTYFKSISAYIKQTYNLEVDKSGKDISRACFLCHDKDVYINPKYLR